MGLLISKKSINGNTRKMRDIDNKLGIFNAKFLRFFLNNKLILYTKIYYTLNKLKFLEKLYMVFDDRF